MSKYVELVKTRTVDLDSYDCVKFYTYLDYFQDIAGEHADVLGVGYDVSKSKNIAWILMKNKLDVLKIPKPYESLVVRTWPSAQSRIDYTRDYEVLDKLGNTIAIGSSQWCIVDLKTRKILRTSALELPADSAQSPVYAEKFKRIENYDYQAEQPKYTYTIQQSDIDHYLHTNNARYAQIVYNAIPERADKTISHFEINYHSETRLNDQIKVYYREENNECLGCGIANDNLVSFSFKLAFMKQS